MPSSPGTCPAIDRNALIEAHLHVVRICAATVARKLPPCVDIDELVAAGNLGLVDAARRFSPSGGANFSTFANYRIVGAIYDYLRSLDLLSRRERREKQSDRELVSIEGYAQRFGDGSQAIRQMQARLEVESLLARLRHRPQLASVVRLRYLEEVSQDEIARRFGLSASRISQLVAEALAEMRRR